MSYRVAVGPQQGQKASMIRIIRPDPGLARVARANGFSLHAVGSCADNAACEGFFGMLKRERVNRRRYQTRTEARADVFDYIERFHNPRRRLRLEVTKQKVLSLTNLSGETG
jgi:hypothetical protein